MTSESLASQRQLMRDRAICVIIPTYNNAGTVADVIHRTLAQCDDVIVVNDGSTDDTLDILNRIDRITLISYSKNRGKGYALKCGFKKAAELGFAYAVTIDSDGQHYPEDIASFVEKNMRCPGSLIVGERDLDGVERSKGSTFANRFSTLWFRIQTFCNVSDTQSGYRLYPVRKMFFKNLITSRYEAELELLVLSAWHGIRIVSTPVRVFYPPREERISHFRPVKDFMRITVLNTVLCVLAVIYALPLWIFRTMLQLLRNAYSLFFFVLFSCCVMTPLAFVCRKLDIHKLIYRMSRFVTITHGIPGVKFRCSGFDEHIFDTPRIIICNHESHLDLMPLLVLSPKIVVLTNDWVWNNPFYGYLIRNAEFLPVSMGLDLLIPRLESLVQRGYSIAVYPEGTRSADCSILRFHQGAFALAQQLHLDILPLVLYGTGKVLPKDRFYLRPGTICLEIDSPVSYDDYAKSASPKEIASSFRKYYIKRYQQLANKIEQYA